MMGIYIQFVTSGFCFNVNEICSLLGSFAA